MKQILVGLSGGVDSALTARRLMEDGYRVTGCFLALCPDADPSRAASVAEALGIPFVTEKRAAFFEKKVIASFLESRRVGDTPNPCVECNANVKIPSLIRVADRLGIESVATGHYARIAKENGRFSLLRGADPNKDQSYFLWRLTQKQLSRLVFPLGDVIKSEVRRAAKDLVRPNEKESMEICFVPDRDTAGFLESRGVKLPEGDFTDEEGRVLGRHGGMHRYTVGQRRGLGVAAAERLFVTAFVPEENRIVLGGREKLLVDRMECDAIHYVSAAPNECPDGPILFQGRHRAKPVFCRVRRRKGRLVVLFDTMTERIAAGQSACFYDGERLLFGARIR